MNLLALLIAQSFVLFVAPSLVVSDSLQAPMSLVGMGVLVAILLGDHRSPLSWAAGAMGAALCSTLSPVAPELAVGALLLGANIERARRARSALALAAHLWIPLVLGTGGAFLVTAFNDAPTMIRLTAATVGGLLVCSPLLLTVDDRETKALLSMSAAVRGPAQDRMRRAAQLRRDFGALDDALAPSTRARLSQAWSSLVLQSYQRVTATPRAAVLLDARIEAHVSALERVYAAAEEAQARATQLDDRTLPALMAEGDALVATAAAMEELAPDVRVAEAVESPTRAGYAEAT